ncbi:MAG: glycosyltransferase family 4 protein, partial [Chlamydiia bacterium]|nr:glycosyltransferase family 4 protein [Chlamydiia bacterium]
MLLLKAFAASSQLGPEDRLVLIGPVTVPRYYKELLNEAERLGVSKRLLLIPGLAQDDPLLTSAFKAADVFVLPSKMEPFGIVVLEAWAAGVPVVASHVGGIPFFCSDLENALLFESENIQECTDALDAALGQTELRQRLVAAARKAVDAYSWPKITKELLAIYAQVREAHGSAKQRR